MGDIKKISLMKMTLFVFIRGCEKFEIQSINPNIHTDMMCIDICRINFTHFAFALFVYYFSAYYMLQVPTFSYQTSKISDDSNAATKSCIIHREKKRRIEEAVVKWRKNIEVSAVVVFIVYNFCVGVQIMGHNNKKNWTNLSVKILCWNIIHIEKAVKNYIFAIFFLSKWRGLEPNQLNTIGKHVLCIKYSRSWTEMRYD